MNNHSKNKLIHIGSRVLLVFILVVFFRGFSFSQTYHTVQPGETLWDISVKYGVPIRSIMKWNNITDMTKVMKGQDLIVSMDKTVKPKTEPKPPTKKETTKPAPTPVTPKKQTTKPAPTPVTPVKVTPKPVPAPVAPTKEASKPKVQQPTVTTPANQQPVQDKQVNANTVQNKNSKGADSTKKAKKKDKYLPVMSDKGTEPVSKGFFEYARKYMTSRMLMIKILANLTLFFFAFIIIVSIIIIISRIRDFNKQKELERFKEKYSNLISYYLFNEYTDLRFFGIEEEMKTKPKRELFLSELLSLHKNFTGDLADKLRNLYLTLGFKELSYKKLKDPNWEMKAKGFRELSQMNIREAGDEIAKYLKSNNEILRLEAELALIKLNERNPMAVFEKMDDILTGWGQMNIQAKFGDKMDVNTYRKLLSSKNESLVIFAIKILGYKKQIDAFDEIVEFLTHRHENVREAAILSTAMMDMPESVELLIERFPKETTANQLTIISALSDIPDARIIDFYADVLLAKNENIIKLLASKMIVKMGPAGLAKQNEVYAKGDDDLKMLLDSNTNR